MARSDLLVSLVRAGAAGDRREVTTAVEAIIAEERAKQHNVLADRLTRALRSNGNGTRAGYTAPEPTARVRDYVVEATPRKRLEDLFLSDLCERACRGLIEEQHRAGLLRSQSLEPRHRVLLVGPPGNGKTSLAEALAEALAVSFFVVRYDSIIGSFLGETASRLRRVFDYARTTPCVLFFDEFDAVGKERGDVNETGEIKRVVTSLLMQVDDRPPIVALLDGIPVQNHQLLDSRLDVDDPDNLEAMSVLSEREHGTAMASLILHGDRNLGEPPISRRLHLRPVMCPPGNGNDEAPRRDRLLVDVIYRAIRRMKEGDGEGGATAPEVFLWSSWFRFIDEEKSK